MDLFGWKCPKCERILSPFVPSCPYCLPIDTAVIGEKVGCPKPKDEDEKDPKVQLTNEILTEWIDGPIEGGGK